MNAIFQRARRSMFFAWLLDNPLLVREIRRRMRGKLFTWSLITYVMALGVVSTIIMFVTYPWAHTDSIREQIQQAGNIGSTLFSGMSFVEFIIAIFIAPMLTAGLATAEKEKDTFDFLRVTTLRARTFVSGCLLTTACFLLLVFTCTLPILGLTFIFGGVSMQEILTFNFMLFMAAMAISAWGIFNSTNYRRSRAVQGSFVILFALAAFIAMRGGLLRTFFGGRVLGVLGAWTLIRYVVPFVVAIVFFSVAASRRLYDPNNRLFNYKQYTLFYASLLAAIFGALYYRLYLAPLAQPDPDVVNGLLVAYFIAGWIFLGASIFIFSAGRIEKGDEVWNLRVQRPFFQRIDERLMLYVGYLILWLGPTYWMGDRWDAKGDFLSGVEASLPIVLISLLAIWSWTLLFSAVADTRNRAALLSIAVLFFLACALPAVGAFLDSVTNSPGSSPSTLGGLALFLVETSPLIALARIWNGSADRDLPSIMHAFLIFFTVAPLLGLISRNLRRRLRVSYTWVQPRTEA